MKVLFFTQFYTPESIAPAFRATENSRIWSRMGHDITVFTGYPNYPTGKIFEGYDPKMLSVESIDNVKVFRSKLIAKPNTSMIRRLENGLSYFYFGLLNITFNKKKIGKDYDVVLGTSGVIFNALLAQIYARKYKIPFVFEIRDITYIQMQATGKDEKKITVKAMKWLELYLCRKAKKVVVVTNGFKKVLVDEGIISEKIEVITNGVDIQQEPNDVSFNSGFVLSYFGTLGISQNIADTFKYAQKMQRLTDKFDYLIIGEGAQKEIIESELQKEDYAFVKMLPGMSADELEPYYRETQMSVITLVKSDKFKYTIPSKLFQIMGRGIAVLYIGPDGECADIINKYNAGLVLSGSDKEDFTVLESFFSGDSWKSKIEQMGKNGSLAVKQNYTRTALAEQYEKILLETIKDE